MPQVGWGTDEAHGGYRTDQGVELMKQLEVQKVAVTKKSEACNILLKDISEKQGAWRGETNYGTGIYVYNRCRRALSSCYTNTFHYCSMSLIYTKFNAKEYA